MKLRLLSVIVTWLVLTCAPPGVAAEEQGEGGPATKDQDAATSVPSKTVASVEPADPDKVKHDGGKTDVDAVGHRNVGCKTGMGNWYWVEKQIAMGKQYAQQVEASAN